MREIKFRAIYYLKNNKKVLSKPFTISEINSRYSERYGNELYVKGKRGEDVEIYGDTEFIQFTGFKDKNEKEIFDGYIMKLENMPKGIPKNYEVIFEDGKFTCGGMEIPHILDFCNGKIMGNKFENPELLK